MRAKRNPVRGPLLTFALMIGSVAAVVVISRYVDSHPSQKPAEQTVAASANSASPASPRQ
ncbi:MAG TPA: hypothetical protein VH183_13805 [Burkholderiaceae bacterium]|nr:hypothetical protein [Burkholderiaceae bacterium]